MVKRKRRPTHFYAIVKMEYGSKEDLFDYRPARILIVLSKKDIDNIKDLCEFAKSKKNLEGDMICIEYPIDTEDIWFHDAEEDADDETSFFPVTNIRISNGKYLYVISCDSNDSWDIVEGEFTLDSLKPVTEWALEAVDLNFEN